MKTETTLAAQQCTCSYHVNYTNISFAKWAYVNQTPPFNRSPLTDFSQTDRDTISLHLTYQTECDKPSKGVTLEGF